MSRAAATRESDEWSTRIRYFNHLPRKASPQAISNALNRRDSGTSDETEFV